MLQRSLEGISGSFKIVSKVCFKTWNFLLDICGSPTIPGIIQTELKNSVGFWRLRRERERERFITWCNQSSGSKIRANLSATKESRGKGEKFERKKSLNRRKVKLFSAQTFFLYFFLVHIEAVVLQKWHFKACPND